MIHDSPPVILIVFNRPDRAARVWERIAEARPRQLFVIADGPRPDRPDDVERCAAARAVTERVDWDCEVQRNYSDVNLGCGMRPATGITWALGQVDRAIVLEDDCLPDPTFFPFCAEMLACYRDDERIVHVAGNNFQHGRQFGGASYFFSHHNLCLGGWATWARAWQAFDMELKQWPALRPTSWLEEIVGDAASAAPWRKIFDDAYAAGTQATYSDYQWTFACWVQRGLSVIPNVELCQNIGFGEDATHTVGDTSPWSVAQLVAMRFPLTHPASVQPDAAADRAFNARVVAAERPAPKRNLRRLISNAWSLLK